tara:strand:+ start:296 stop:511 length:216 start_codon:yes stop_codon:yes gene_type:complete
MISFQLTPVQLTLCKQALANDQGEVLCDIVTDQIVLSEQLSAEEAKGAGSVLKFLRSLHNDTDNLVSTPTK